MSEQVQTSAEELMALLGSAGIDVSPFTFELDPALLQELMPMETPATLH
jgi:hypothetical protein